MSRALAAAGVVLSILLILSVATPAAAQSAEDDPWLGPDKALHFGLSAALAGGGYGLGAIFWEDYAPRFLLGGGIALAAGIAKELVDLGGAGDASWRDMTWNLLGIASGLLVAWLVDVLVRGFPPPHRTSGAADLAQIRAGPGLAWSLGGLGAP